MLPLLLPPPVAVAVVAAAEVPPGGVRVEAVVVIGEGCPVADAGVVATRA